MTWRKRHQTERKSFNTKLKNSASWQNVFEYSFLSEIIEICLPKINVSYVIFLKSVDKYISLHFYCISGKY